MEPTSSTRRLSAILMADVVGYSRLMGQDEERTVATLRPSRRVLAAQLRVGYWARPSAPRCSGSTR